MCIAFFQKREPGPGGNHGEHCGLDREEASRTYARWTSGTSQASPPPTTLGAPWGRGCPLPAQKHGRSCRTSSTLQHHSPGGCPSDCDLQLH
jgi:hypothetical protein